MWSAAPASRASTASSSLSCSVIMITGVHGATEVIRRKTAKPSESPIWVSRMTSEGDPEDSSASPSSPVAAVRTSNPSTEAWRPVSYG